MKWIFLAGVCATLVCLSSGCGSPPEPVEPVEVERASAPACEPDTSGLDAQLAGLDAARAAIQSDPLDVRPGAMTSADTAVELADARAASLARMWVVEVGPQAIHVNGQALPPADIDDRDGLLVAVSARLGPASVPAGTSDAYARPLVLVVHPDTPWSTVQVILRAARQAQVPRVLLGFATPSSVTPPEPGALAWASADEAETAFAACPEMAAVLRASPVPGRGAIDQALRACRCATTPERVLAYLYQRVGLAARAGRIPAMVAMDLERDVRSPKDPPTVVALPADRAWSEAHGAVLDAIRAGQPVRARIQGEPDPNERRPGRVSSGGAVSRDAADPAGQEDADPSHEPRGSRKRASRDRSQLRIVKAGVEGSLQEEIVYRRVRRKLPRIRACYTEVLATAPTLQGVVETTIIIDAEGQVSDARASGVHKRVSGCIADVLMSIPFPKPEDGGKVRARYNFVFSPTGG